jgi:hypothetical protein
MNTPTRSATAAALDLGPVGIWSAPIRFAPGGAGIDAASELERLGFSAVWVPGGIDNGVLQTLDALLTATSTIKVGSGILNIWKHDPADVAAWWNGQSPQRQKRLILGLGVSRTASQLCEQLVARRVHPAGPRLSERPVGRRPDRLGRYRCHRRKGRPTPGCRRRSCVSSGHHRGRDEGSTVGAHQALAAAREADRQTLTEQPDTLGGSPEARR